jgi:YHS domain-containing protein
MIFGWLIRFLVVMLLVRLVWRFLTAGAQGARRQPQVSPTAGVPLVRDPVCGMYIDPGRALTLRHGSETHRFCSEDCRTTFQRERRASAKGA